MKFLGMIGRLGILLPALCVYAPVNQATHLENAEQTQQQIQRDGRQSQHMIEKLDDQTQAMFREYRDALQELENLRVYHGQLDKIVISQEAEKQSLDQQLQEIEVTRRNILPLMVRMMDVLQQFVQLDIPFLQQERATRIQELQQMMDRSDIDIAEKYRRLVEAYMVEIEYGRTIEAYSGMLELDGKTRSVEFLRCGRVALYYVTLDQQQAGYWDRQQRRWQPSATAVNEILRGLRIAKKQAAPDLVTLPIAAPEVVQ